MPGLRDHGIGAIGVALPGIAGMDMHIGDDGQTALPAHRPQPPEILAVEADDSGVETVWIEIVIQDEIADPRGAIRVGITEQEGAAFTAFAAPTLAQSRGQSPPQKPGA